ncbi:hypothetical protein U1Q18_003962 [Sarracenia purpurea var. burkii]
MNRRKPLENKRRLLRKTPLETKRELLRKKPSPLKTNTRKVIHVKSNKFTRSVKTM